MFKCLSDVYSLYTFAWCLEPRPPYSSQTNLSLERVCTAAPIISYQLALLPLQLTFLITWNFIFEHKNLESQENFMQYEMASKTRITPYSLALLSATDWSYRLTKNLHY